ncbi:MAG TPA: VTT domain-containing protein [Gammaproteobacteria bacterium]|nr:VTT domain-containing protein [Gammaproteobacteria bacterium]
MLPATLQPFLDWLALHPTWAGMAVFVIAASESLAVVGLFVPGALLLFGIGALVAAGSLELVPTLAWATAGAVAGDGLSFWLGRHFHQRLRLLWPFSRSPELMARAVDFFDRHGGKSVVMARFVGPLRPIIPAVAGMMDMSPARFFWINVLSAAVWAPAYILPGMALGASLQLAAQVAGRLVVLIVLLLAAVWLCLWLVRQVFRLVQPHASALIGRALDWSRGHPVIRPLAGALLDPEHPEARGLAMLAIILVVTAWLFAAVLAAVVHGSPLQGLDLLLYRWLQNLRTPWADRVMVALTELGDATVLTAVVAATALWLAWRRRWKALGHWLATAAGAAIMVRILKLTLQVPRPAPLYEGAGAFAFPSAHAGTNLAVYGFLAVLVARELAPERRWLPYVGASALIVLIAFSRLYLGAHWLSDVIGGLALGLSWTALMGIAYRRHPAPPVALRGLLAVVLVALTAAGGWQISRHLNTDLVRYARRHTTVTLAPSAWWNSGWRDLPAYRMDLEGEREHPLTVQWAGNLPTLKATLTRHGWRTPAAATVADSLRWLSPATPFRELPVLPQVHAGRHEALLLTHATDNPDRLLVLRLWPTAVVLGSRQQPVWIGNVSELIRERLLGFVTLPHTARDYDAPLRVLAGDLAGLDVKRVRRSAPRRKGEEAPRWDGRVLLIRNPPADGAPTADPRPGGTLPKQIR